MELWKLYKVVSKICSYYLFSNEFFLVYIFRLPNKEVKFSLKIFSPPNPGSYQVVLFVLGLDGIVPSFAYNNLSSLLALESSTIVVAFNKLTLIYLPDEEELYYESTFNWTLANLNELFKSESAPFQIRGLVQPDFDKNGVSLMSHSAVAHTNCLYLVKNCGLIKNLILLDPVDGFDPFGIVKSFVIHPPAKLPFLMPTLIVSSGLSSSKSSFQFEPCAPTNMSNLRFYDSLAGPVWYLNFTNYGHGDLLDEWVFNSIL